MAISASTLGTNSGSSISSISVSSLAPTGSTLMLAIVGLRDGVTIPTGTMSDNITGNSWTHIGNATEVGTTVLITCQVFYSVMPASPGTGRTVTWTRASGAPDDANLVIVEVTGADTNDVLEQTAVNNQSSGTTFTITTSTAVKSGNAAFGAFMNRGNGPIEPGTGYTELAEIMVDSFDITNVIYNPTETGTTIDWSTVDNVQTTGIAWEINALKGGAAGVLIGL